MDYLDKDESEEFEKIVINFLLKNKKGSLDDIYATCRDSTPYFLLKDILFHMFKKNLLRRKLTKNEPTLYCLTSEFPDFGTAYVKRKGHVPAIKKEKPVSCVESCREKSKVLELDQLLKNVRENS